MRQKTNQILYGYWNDVRGNRMAPRRFEIEPARIASILPETFILERLNLETFPYRLAGTKLCEQFGAEYRATNFLDGWAEEDRVTLVRQLGTVSSQGAVLVLDIAGIAIDRRQARFEATLMPLVHTSTTVSRYLGAMSAIDPPAWLGSERLVHKRLIGHQVIWPEGRPHTIAQSFRDHAPALSALSGARLVKIDRRSFRVLDGGRSEPSVPAAKSGRGDGDGPAGAV